MSRFFLSTRVRAFSFAFTSFGLATVMPPGIKGFWPFMLSPAGVTIGALGLVMLGVTLEESGTVARIRIGIGARLVAFGLVLFAGVWGFFLNEPLASLFTFGVVLYGLGAAGAAVSFRHDLRVFDDVRHGQAIRLEKITPEAVSFVVSGVTTSIPTGLVRAVSVAKGLGGRGVFVLVAGREKIVGAANQLPWISASREGDTFVLTEHEAGLDAEVIATRLLEAATAAREGGYR